MKHENLINIIKERKFTWIGIRSLNEDEQYNVGDTCRYSYDWNFEFDRSTYGYENEELNGTSAINANIDYVWDEDEEMEGKIESTLEKVYWKDYGIVVIGGKKAEYGSDDDEIIIENAEVIYKF